MRVLILDSCEKERAGRESWVKMKSFCELRKYRSYITPSERVWKTRQDTTPDRPRAPQLFFTSYVRYDQACVTASLRLDGER